MRTKLVRPEIGSGGDGHTFPGATYPFGLVQPSPDTGREGYRYCAGYRYEGGELVFEMGAAIKAYIFDMDGTLVDNCAWHVKAWREFAVRHGREITEREILEWMGAPSAYYMNRIFDREVPPDECAALTREKESLYRELYAPHLRLPDGLDELLRNARSQGMRLAIATGGSMDNVDFVLDGLGLRDLFEVVVDASQYEHGKPAPDCYLMAAARLGLAPSECLVFEDAVGGIRAAKAAGMRVAAITATMPRNTLAEENPDILLDSFVQFPLAQK